MKGEENGPMLLRNSLKIRIVILFAVVKLQQNIVKEIFNKKTYDYENMIFFVFQPGNQGV